jgi:hypothetical protein
MARASVHRCVLGQLQPHQRAVREAVDPDPDDHRQLRRRSARCDGALSAVHEARERRRARAALPRHRSLGSRRYAHAASAVRRADVRSCEPGRSAEAAPRLVRVDDAERPEAEVPAEERRVLRDGCRQVALRGHARRRDGGIAAVLPRTRLRTRRRARVGLARKRKARASPIITSTIRTT